MGDEPATLCFSSTEEEVTYWKTRCRGREDELVVLQQQFAEFQESSVELEAEMEKELERAEARVQQLAVMYERLQDEHMRTSERYTELSRQSGHVVENLQTEMHDIQSTINILNEAKRRLELDNDDLERRERRAEASVHDLTSKLDRALEQAVLTQCELEEEHNRSASNAERLREEIRDLKSELQARSTIVSGISTRFESLVGKKSQTTSPIRRRALSFPGGGMELHLKDMARVVPSRLPRIAEGPVSEGTSPVMEQRTAAAPTTPPRTPSTCTLLPLTPLQRKVTLSIDTAHSLERTPSGYFSPSKSPGVPDMTVHPKTVVSDMLHRVKSLEQRLQSCRSSLAQILRRGA